MYCFNKVVHPRKFDEDTQNHGVCLKCISLQIWLYMLIYFWVLSMVNLSWGKLIYFVCDQDHVQVLLDPIKS